MSSSTVKPGRTAVDGYLDTKPAETLAAMVRTIGKLYQKLDGLWYVAVMERWGNEAALDLDIWVWERAAKREVALLARALGLEGKKDLASFLRVFTAGPMTMTAAYSTEDSKPGEVVVTISNCAILEALEKEGKGREKTICSMVEKTIFSAYARHFGADFTVQALKLPPRVTGQQLCCQWRLTAPHETGPVVLPDPFDPTQVSRQALIDLIKTYGRLYEVVDGYWYLGIKERWGNDVALETDKKVWGRLTKLEVAALIPVIGLAGKTDMKSFVELFLATPINLITDYTVDRLTENEAVVSFSFCPVLRALEKEGEGREAQICRDVDPLIFGNYAKFFNPAITIEPVMTPPRQNKDQLPLCTWKFTLK